MSPIQHSSLLIHQTPSTGVGYRLAETDQEERHALETAVQLLKSARQAGIEVRMWSKRKGEDVAAAIQWLMHRQGLSSGPMPRTVMAGNRAVVEGEVVAMVGRYMRAISDIKHRLSLLNPPLTGQDLKPFFEAVDFDHHITVVNLQPLQKRLQEWRAISPDAIESPLPN
jgi:hypothetical protein